VAAGIDVAAQLAVDDDVRRTHLALDHALVGQRHDRVRAVLVGDHGPLDRALDVEAAAEVHVAPDRHARADQGLDAAARIACMLVLVTVAEHVRTLLLGWPSRGTPVRSGGRRTATAPAPGAG